MFSVKHILSYDWILSRWDFSFEPPYIVHSSECAPDNFLAPKVEIHQSLFGFSITDQVKKSEDSYYLCPLAQCGLVHLVSFGFIWLSLVWCSAHVPFLAHSVWLYGSPRETQRPWESLSTNLFNVSSPACPTLILKREQINSPFI